MLAADMTPPSRAMDFTQGTKPEAKVSDYSLRWEGVSGIPNGIEEKGADATQIYVSKITKGALGDGRLQVGEVICHAFHFQHAEHRGTQESVAGHRQGSQRHSAQRRDVRPGNPRGGLQVPGAVTF